MPTATAKKSAAKKSTEPVPTEKVNGNNGANRIRQKVQSNKGIVKVTLGEIRDELGHARLGRTVLQSMANHLSENGLGFFPSWVLSEGNPQPRQWEEIWVYERDNTARSAVLDAVSDPDNNDLAGALNLFNAEAPDYSKMNSEQKLTLIKSILCS